MEKYIELVKLIEINNNNINILEISRSFKHSKTRNTRLNKESR
jgi:hypothetical protein